VSKPNLLLLEDDAERLARFHVVIARLGMTIHVWRSAYRLLAELDRHIPLTQLIALDHDLLSEPGEPDLGDGLMVAKALANRRASCPVIIHTSNTLRGDSMEGELQLAGWTYRRILPIGDDWIEVDWFRAARRLLRGAKPP
jgi:CheY-like chemotaxis protein